VYAKENSYPFIFARAAHDDIILAIFNPANREAAANFSLNISAKEFKLLSGSQSKIEVKDEKYSLKIGAGLYSVYKLKK
jgi:hypothetical protein